MTIQAISPLDLQQQLTEPSADYFLLDVREVFEYEIAHIAGSHLIPMNQIADRMDEIERKKIIAICHHGMRSAQVAHFLDEQGFTVFNLTGGIDAWAKSCDANMSLY